MKGKMKAYEGGKSDVAKEAKGAEPDEKATPHRKRGGMVEGMAAKKRMDRPMRKAGGPVGADKKPLTEAANSGKPKSRSLMAAGMEP